MALKTLLETRGRQIAAAFALTACGVLISGCSSDEEMAAQYVERPIEQIYADAWTQIGAENWLQAGRQFDEVERQHPYSIWARRAILMSAYCYYQGHRYSEAIDASTRQSINFSTRSTRAPAGLFHRSATTAESICALVSIAMPKHRTCG